MFLHLRRLSTTLGLCLLAIGLSSQGTNAESIPRCDYYASPAGSGNGTSSAKAFQVADFWRHASPGKTLCLLDGVYEDPKGMVDPPSGLNGAEGSPITIRALNDGKVLIDGSGERLPVRLFKNDWFVVEGVNACCSSGTVVGLDRSSRNVIRRVAAWDAADLNDFIFGIHHGDHNLLEDVAGWGIARKIFAASQGGDFTTVRRAWGRWEGSHVNGAKVVYSLAYNNYNMLVENSIGTWSGEKMQKTYTLLDYKGKPYVGRGEGTYQNSEVNQPYAIFGMDRLDRDKKANARLLGSIAYITARDSFKAPRLVFVTKLDFVQIGDTLAYVEQGSYPRVTTFGLYGLTGSMERAGAAGLSARNLSSLGGGGAIIGKDWKTENVVERDRPQIGDPTKSVFNPASGIDLCRRYVDGVLTTQPLWPWPMNDRIVQAMRGSGRSPVDVTTTIELLLGPIPRQCRSTAEDPGARQPDQVPRNR